ncbi:MAG: AraC family transcriptional regulator [Verrucomicrobiota bacterium]
MSVKNKPSPIAAKSGLIESNRSGKPPLQERTSQFFVNTSDGRLAAGRTLYLPGGSVGPRWQTCYQLIPVHTGSVVIQVDGISRTIAAGQVALLLPGHEEFFAFSAEGPTSHSYCRASPQSLPSSLKKALAGAPCSSPLTPRLQDLLQAMWSDPIEPPGDIMLTHLAAAVFAEYVDAAARKIAGGPQSPEALVRVRRLVREHYAEPMELADLARAAAVTPRHLIRIFRVHLQTTPMRYLWQTRVEQAERLLDETGLTLSEIAERTGFQNPFHFSRVMRLHLGCSPSVHRSRLWTADRT